MVDRDGARMPLTKISLPQGAHSVLEVELAYLTTSKGPHSGSDAVVTYLQGIRSGSLAARCGGDPEQSDDALFYKKGLPALVCRLADTIGCREFDIVVVPPSSRLDAIPYAEEFKKRNPSAVDWTKEFRNPSGLKSGPGVSFDDFRDAIEFTPPPHVAPANRALIVDEALSKGTTAGVIAFHLRSLPQIDDIEIIVAAPLWHPAR